MTLVAETVAMPILGYYNYFPPKWTNVSVESRSGPESQSTRSVLVLNKDVKAGDMIYKVALTSFIKCGAHANISRLGISHRYCPRC